MNKAGTRRFSSQRRVEAESVYGPKRQLAESQPHVRSWGEAACRDRSADAIDPQQTSQRACSGVAARFEDPAYRRRLQAPASRAERGLLSNLLRQSRKIVSAVK